MVLVVTGPGNHSHELLTDCCRCPFTHSHDTDVKKQGPKSVKQPDVATNFPSDCPDVKSTKTKTKKQEEKRRSLLDSKAIPGPNQKATLQQTRQKQISPLGGTPKPTPTRPVKGKITGVPLNDNPLPYDFVGTSPPLSPSTSSSGRASLTSSPSVAVQKITRRSSIERTEIPEDSVSITLVSDVEESTKTETNEGLVWGLASGGNSIWSTSYLGL